jgi:hypothetical protein
VKLYFDGITTVSTSSDSSNTSITLVSSLSEPDASDTETVTVSDTSDLLLPYAHDCVLIADIFTLALPVTGMLIEAALPDDDEDEPTVATTFSSATVTLVSVVANAPYTDDTEASPYAIVLKITSLHSPTSDTIVEVLSSSEKPLALVLDIALPATVTELRLSSTFTTDACDIVTEEAFATINSDCATLNVPAIPASEISVGTFVIAAKLDAIDDKLTASTTSAVDTEYNVPNSESRMTCLELTSSLLQSPLQLAPFKDAVTNVTANFAPSTSVDTFTLS